MSPPLVPAAALPGWPGHCTCPPHRTADRSCLGGGRGGGGGLVGGWVSWWLVVGLVEGWVGKPTGMPDSPHSSPDFNQPASNSCETYFPSSLHPPPRPLPTALLSSLLPPHLWPPGVPAACVRSSAHYTPPWHDTYHPPRQAPHEPPQTAGEKGGPRRGAGKLGCLQQQQEGGQ